jgi:hypothetical protein
MILLDVGVGPPVDSDTGPQVSVAIREGSCGCAFSAPFTWPRKRRPFEILGAFLAEREPGQEGIYWIDRGQGYHSLIERGQMLDGKVVDHLDLGRDGASAEVVAFHARFTDGSAGVSFAVIPEPAAAALTFLIIAPLARRRCCR